MTVRLKEHGPAITAETVAGFELTLPGPLPDDYKAFLQRTNGGVPEANWRPPELGGDGMGVAGFMSLGDVESYDSLVETRALFTGRIPGHLLAVAYDDGDAQVCLSLAADDHGTVWLFDPEREFDPEEVQDPELLVRLADSFGAFLDALEPPPAYEERIRRTGV